MEFVHDLTEPLRAALLQQTWLEGWASTIEATPDWALLAAGPTAIALTWILARLFGGGGKRRQATAREKETPPESRRASEAAPPPPVSNNPQSAAASPSTPEPAPPPRDEPPAAGPAASAENTQENGAARAPSASPNPDPPPPPVDSTGSNADEAVMLAAIALKNGDKNAAIGFYETAVARDPGHSHAWCQLGGLYGQTERYDASQQAFQKALETASTASEEGVALWGLALAAVDRKDLETAEAFFDRAAARLEGVGDETETLVKCARNAATLKQNRGAPDAETALERARILARDHKMPEEEVQCVQGLIQIARAAAQFSKVEDLLPEALRLQSQLGMKHDQAVSLGLLRNFAWQKKDSAPARAYALEALDLFRELGDKKGEATELYWLGVIQRDDDDPSAYATFEQCLSIAEAEALTRVTIDALNKLGDLDYRADRFESAERHLSRAAELAAAAGDAQAEALALRTLGCVAEDQGDDEAKTRHWRNALSRATAANDQRLIGDLKDMLGGG